MTYRVCRKRSTSTFKVNDQYCKVFLTPSFCFKDNHWAWKVGFAVSKSKRQLNDWYQERKNKRARQLRTQLTGKGGFKTISRGFKTVLNLRWNLEPGDCLFLDCTSKEPDKQFHAWSHWLERHPDWLVNFENLQFWWHRPPYHMDPIYQMAKVIPTVPVNPLAPSVGEQYFDGFLIDLLPAAREDMLQSTVEILNQSFQDQSHCIVDSNQIEETGENLHHQQ